MSRHKDISGLVFGRITAIKRVENKGKEIMYLCKCECGTEKIIRCSHLTSGAIKSCGNHNSRKKHGLSRTTEYRSWSAMMKRCYSPSSDNYHYYGGKGITVCKRWHDFEKFIKDMGNKPDQSYSLDRYPDRKGNYKPDNCRWATQEQQHENRDCAVLLTFNGETKMVAKWAERCGVTRGTIHGRMKRGLQINQILKEIC